jgi:drug/metabolite transporter (DMT)-like permease
MDRVFWIYFVIVSLGSTTFATTVYFISVHNLGSKKASVFTFLVPFFALGSSKAAHFVIGLTNLIKKWV